MTSEKSVNVILNANCAEHLRRVTDLALVHEMFTFLGCYKDLKFKDAQNGKKKKKQKPIAMLKTKHLKQRLKIGSGDVNTLSQLNPSF